MENWKDINGYEGIYQISDMGRVKSLMFGKDRILKTCLCRNYKSVGLHKHGSVKTFQVHQLVAVAFLNHIPCGYKFVIDHIDFDISNNNVSNLRIVTNRENTNQQHIKNTSKYIGVCWKKKNKKWCAQIYINGKQKYLGLFNNEIDAHHAYQSTLIINN